MKEIQPEFADKVSLYLVRADPSEDLEYLEEYRKKNEYPWPVSIPDDDMLSNFRVISQSTKVAVNGDGIITYRDGYGRGGDSWEDVFSELVSQ
ncbi:MAG: hypothetical protein O2821_08540 [Chloroflexi bacterium]|nr:hypothetical protein [Chloroflexota bacterium]MDA1228181.1 hypothetical protein [Chloroflexota bacterium]